ncbi:MAG: CPXCG motif-containing cysteine-rich protein [Campylobacterota bacterium]|nr:CPXCG motif-containing cysteine-rich protein [Campylobacterota bacterium]
MEEKHIQCPYCLQAISILLDTGIEGSSSIVDDCEVCCRPIEIDYTVRDFEVILIDYHAIDGNEF